MMNVFDIVGFSAGFLITFFGITFMFLAFAIVVAIVAILLFKNQK